MSFYSKNFKTNCTVSCVSQRRENSSGDVIMMQSELPQLGLGESFFNRKPVLQTWDSLKNIDHTERVKVLFVA